jgi:LysM repeat protein
MRTTRIAGFIGATASAGTALAAVSPAPSQLPALLAGIATAPQATADARGADYVALTVVAVLAWLTLGWLLACAAFVVAAALPGRLGACAEAASRVLLPGAARQLIAVALGVTVSAGVSATAAAAAPGGRPAEPASVATIDLDWPAEVASPNLAGKPAAPASPPPDAAPPSQVVVRPGDSLWRIAARDLGPTATDDQISEAWPRWWTANRAVIGADPELIQPGQRLTPPPSAPVSGPRP